MPKKTIKTKARKKKPKNTKVTLFGDIPNIEKERADKLIPSEMLSEIGNGNKDAMDIVLFTIAYHKFSRNATKAYKYLHPNCTSHSCRVLGSRMVAKLAKVNMTMLLDSYELGPGTFFESLKKGLNASEIELVDEEVVTGDEKKVVQREVVKPLHSVRKEYFDVLREMLGFGGEKTTAIPANNIQINNANSNSIDNIDDNELEDLIS